MFKLKSKIKYLLGALIALMFKVQLGSAQSSSDNNLIPTPVYGPMPSSVSNNTPLVLSIIGLIGLIIGVVIYIKSKKK